MPLLDVDRDAPDTGYNRTERRAIKLSGVLVAAVAVTQVRVLRQRLCSLPAVWLPAEFFALTSDYERCCWLGLCRWSLGFACCSI